MCLHSIDDDNPAVIITIENSVGVVVRKTYYCPHCEAILRQKDYDG